MTKTLNKKGTSLVELIAVIVIMGIIAGIAIPTTIAVIDRQKQNAAIKSAQTVLDAAKQVLLEASADETSEVIVTTSADDGVKEDPAGTFTINNKGLLALGELEKDPVGPGNTIIIKYVTADNEFTVTATNISMSNGKKVTWDSDKGVFKKGA